MNMRIETENEEVDELTEEEYEDQEFDEKEEHIQLEIVTDSFDDEVYMYSHMIYRQYYSMISNLINRCTPTTNPLYQHVVIIIIIIIADDL